MDSLPNKAADHGMTKVHAAYQEAERIVKAFDQRRDRLWAMLTPPTLTAEEVTDPDADLYGDRALACLIAGRHVAAANAHLRHVTRWFEHPHPTGRNHKGECDFAAMKLCRTFRLFDAGEPLEAETVRCIRRFFLETDFASHHDSENHHLLFRTSRLLMAEAMPDETFAAWGADGRVLAAEDRDWIDRFIRFRARRGWGEFDSACYVKPVWECLTNLFDYAGDDRLGELVRMMMDLVLADMAVDSLEGMYCGAHGRIYAPHAMDHAAEPTYALTYLYFGRQDPAGVLAAPLIDALVSSYRPPPLVVRMALDRSAPYENRERKHLHNVDDVLGERPLAGSIRKLTWMTPRYALGAVTRQDPYPPDLPGAWYAHHEQHEWDLTIGGRSTRCRLFTHHPGEFGNEHGYWTGDMRCGCGHFFQQRQALVGLYDIPADQPCGFIHAYVPEDQFDEVRQDGPWLFVRAGEVYAALRMLGGHEPTTVGPYRGVEIRSPGRRNGAVCEVGTADAFDSFDEFRRAVAAAQVQFDPEAMSLSYHSLQAGVLTMDTRGRREIDGRPADLDYPAWDSPFIQSAWDSGLIRLMHGSESLTLDFRVQRLR